jgi:hypothetical protein
MASIAVVKLPVARFQVFLGGLPQGGVSLWGYGGASSEAWTAPSAFRLTTDDDETDSDFDCVAACNHENGSPQVWGVPTERPDTLNTRYKNPGESAWTHPEAIIQPEIEYAVNGIAAGYLATEGKIQLFACIPDTTAGHSTLVTSWQKEPNSQSFTDWKPMVGAPELSPESPFVTTSLSPDGRLQVWAASATELFTTWKSTTRPGASWIQPWASAGPAPTQLTIGVLEPNVGGVWATGLGGEGQSGFQPGIESPVPSATLGLFNEFPPIGPSTAKFIDALTSVPVTDTTVQLFAFGRDEELHFCLWTAAAYSVDNLNWRTVMRQNT